MKMRYVLIVFISLFLTMLASASDSPSKSELRVIYRVSRAYNVDVQDLIRIAYVETKFKQNSMRSNRNKTIDYGMFQINSVHWSTTCKDLNIMKLYGNASCAARLIKQAKVYSNRDIMWLARYHSKTHSKKIIYTKLLQNIPKVLLVMADE